MVPLAFQKPMAGVKTPAMTPGEQAIKSKKIKTTVLLIEPDASVRDALTILLEGENWHVVS